VQFPVTAVVQALMLAAIRLAAVLVVLEPTIGADRISMVVLTLMLLTTVLVPEFTVTLALAALVSHSV
jgi:hypothetical protein